MFRQFCFFVDYLPTKEGIKLFPRAGNNPGVLKNSTEQAEPLFIALIYHLFTIERSILRQRNSLRISKICPS